MLREYWKHRLSPNAASLYDDMFRSISGLKEEIACGKIDPQEVMEVYMALSNDYPELFHMPYNPQIMQSMGMFGKTSVLRIGNLYENRLIRRYQSELAKLKKEIVSQIGTLHSEQEKERAVCDYIIENTTYEINNAYHQNAVAVLIEHKGQCSGIAKAAKLLLEWCGIESMVVNGNIRDSASGVQGPHAWNIVQIGGECYHLDVTSMMGANTNKVKPFRYLYFNYSDEEIRRNHSWQYDATPRCNASMAAPEDTVPSAAGNCSHQIAVSSLFELREELKKAFGKGEHGIAFDSRIPVPDNKLMGYVQSCCKEALRTSGQPRNISIAIQGKQITLSW